MKLKKFCYTAFVAFWSSIATLVALHVLAGEGGPAASEDKDKQNGETVYTLEQVAQHDSQEDCWMAIEGQVYDLSDYIDKHPTAPSVIVTWCGTEATEGMRTKGYGNDHSETAWNLLKQYRIGQLQE